MAQGKVREKGELACDPCRQLKVKCRRDPEDPSTCQKCRRHAVTCTWPELRVRTRKPRSKSAAKIQALEDKIDQLLNVVENDSARQKRTPSSMGTSPSLIKQDEPMSLSEDLLEHFGVSQEVANQYLRTYRSMTLYFPFVILPSSISAAILARDKPMLYLAILTVSSMEDRDLQLNLEKQLRKEFAERMLVRQEKSLDLLAALLVYLGWSQFFHLPKRDSVAQFMSLAVTVCDELGLGYTHEEAYKRQFQPFIEPRDDETQNLSAEARRLYLGTYFLLNDYGWAFGESSKVRDWSHVVDVAESLAGENEYATDALISCLVRMQSVAARYHAIFAEYQNMENIDPLQFAAQIDDAEEQITMIGHDLPPLLQQSAILDMTRYFTLIYTFEADLVNPFLRRRPMMYPEVQFMFTSVLNRALSAIGAFLESFLTMPASEYHHFSFHQWTGIDYAIIMLYKLSLGLSRVLVWDVDVARATVPFEPYMEQFISIIKMAKKLRGPQKDMYSLHEQIWEDTLTAYLKKKNLPLADRLSSNSMEVHRRAFGIEKKVRIAHSTGSPASTTTSYSAKSSPSMPSAAIHPCPAHIYWRQ